LGLIAKRHRVSLHDLRRWNHLKGDHIRVGQRLVLHRQDTGHSVAAETAGKDEANAAPATEGDNGYIYHTIQPGDTLWEIAKSYPGVSVEDLKHLNQGMNFRHLTVGKKIRVGVEKG